MKTILRPLLSLSLLLFLTNCLNAQAPTRTWERFLPGDYEIGNYTANELKESPYQRTYVLVGSRSMNWKGYGYNDVMVMRFDQEGGSIRMNETFTGFGYGELYEGGEWVPYQVPWSQVANDMMFIQEEDLRYLITG